VNDDIKAAAARAADWLAANPTKHIARSLAIDAAGRKVAPTSDKAECFCALGRFARELNLPGNDSSIYAEFFELKIDYDAIFEANDEDTVAPYENGGDRRIPVVHPEKGIAALRSLAA